MKRFLIPGGLVVLVLAYPLITAGSPVYQRLGALVLLAAIGASAWNMRLQIWLAHPGRHSEVHSDINCAIVRKFRQNGVEIPFPQHDLRLRSPLPLPVANGAEMRRSA